MTLNHPGFGGTVIGHFHFQNNETEGMLAYHRNPVRVELFKVYMTRKIVSANLKGLSKFRMVFLFLKYFFVLEILTFFYYAY